LLAQAILILLSAGSVSPFLVIGGGIVRGVTFIFAIQQFNRLNYFRGANSSPDIGFGSGFKELLNKRETSSLTKRKPALVEAV
jgi:hypothetical protein